MGLYCFWHFLKRSNESSRLSLIRPGFKSRHLHHMLCSQQFSQVQYCWNDTSGKIRFTTCTGGQVVATRHTRSCRVENAYHYWVYWSKEQTWATRRNKRPIHCVCLFFFFKAKIRHEPLGGTSALCIVYASFFKQRSDINHAKGQAR